MPAKSSNNIEFMLGQIHEKAEVAARERAEGNERLARIEEHLARQNGRIGKLEEATDGHSELLDEMAGPVQTVESVVRTVRNWGWRLAALIIIGVVTGNQMASRLIDFIVALTK